MPQAPCSRCGPIEPIGWYATVKRSVVREGENPIECASTDFDVSTRLVRSFQSDKAELAIATREDRFSAMLQVNRMRLVALIGLLTAVYIIAGRFGLSLAFLHPSATPVWPPTGLALATLLLFGYRLWPGVLIGAFWVNFATAGDLATSAGIALGNTAEALLGAWLVIRYAKGAAAFDHPGSIFRFVFLAAVCSTAVSASVGVTSLYLGGLAPWEDYFSIWLTWWLGDTASNLIVAPLLLVWGANPFPRAILAGKKIAAAGAFMLLAFVLAQIVFTGWLRFFDHYPLAFLCLPPVLWAAYRYGPHGAVTTVFLVSATAIWGTHAGHGPFTSAGANESLVVLQAFMATIALTATVLAALVAERNQTEAALRESTERLAASEGELRQLNGYLEQRVAERALSLEQAHAALVQDIQARLQLEEKLRQNERLSALGLATAKIVHEIGNPLNGIATTAQVLIRRFKANATTIGKDVADMATEIHGEVDRLRGLLDEIRSFSSPNLNALKLEPTNLASLAGQVLARECDNYHGHGITIEHELPADSPLLMIDRKKITQVLLNLYKNAAEAMPNGGVLRVRSYRTAAAVCLEIADTGVGIPNALNVFEALTTTKSSGMGIGLAVAKQFVEAHGGSIGYTSEIGQGTVFTLTLPLVNRSAGEPGGGD